MTEPITNEMLHQVPAPTIEIQNIDGLLYLSTIPNGSIDLVLTDPPYIISRESGMNTHYNTVKHNEYNNIEFVKTEEEWKQYKSVSNFCLQTR